MAKRTTEVYISQMERTVAYWKKKADCKYAYAKNLDDGYHYGYAKKAYTKAKEFTEGTEVRADMR